MKIFFSYAHEDERLRNELEIHLSALKRQGIIDTWHDRRLVAGSDFASAIDDHLEAADVVLLLVSPYFLSSDYCYDREMRRAIERHEEGSCVVIPVILHPCDWQETPFGGLRATPPDGVPVSKHANIHDAFLKITQDIRELAESRRQSAAQEPVPREADDHLAQPEPAPSRTSNLRVRREFSDHDRDTFRDATFEYISNFFESSLAELKQRNHELGTRFRRTDENGFSAAVYVGGEKRSGCRVWLADGTFGGDIAYSANESASSTSMNDSMRVTDDGYSQGLEPLGLALYGPRSNEMLTRQGAAEYFWAVFIRPLQ